MAKDQTPLRFGDLSEGQAFEFQDPLCVWHWGTKVAPFVVDGVSGNVAILIGEKVASGVIQKWAWFSPERIVFV